MEVTISIVLLISVLCAVCSVKPSFSHSVESMVDFGQVWQAVGYIIMAFSMIGWLPLYYYTTNELLWFLEDVHLKEGISLQDKLSIGSAIFLSIMTIYFNDKSYKLYQKGRASKREKDE